MSDDFDREDVITGQNANDAQQPAPDKKTEGFIESTYYINKLYPDLFRQDAELAKGLDPVALSYALILRNPGIDKDKVSNDLWNLDNLYRGVLRGFVIQHDEALKECYKDVTGKELDKEEPLTEDVIKAYSELGKDNSLKQHAEAIRYAGDSSADYIKDTLKYTYNALAKIAPNSPQYPMVNKWADRLAINLFYHNAVSAIQKATDDALRTRNNGGGTDPKELEQLNNVIRNYDSALRGRFKFLSNRLEILGEGGTDSPEFNKFSEALQLAADQCTFDTLGDLVKEYASSCNPNNAADLERLAIARDVIRFVSFALPAVKKVTAALRDINSIKYGDSFVSLDSENEPDAAEIQKVIQAGKNVSRKFKVGEEFKERIKDLFDGYELTSSEELLLKFAVKYVKNGVEMASQTEKWLIEACNLKEEGKDYSALQKKISNGIKVIKAESIKNIEQRAAQNDKFIANMCQGGRDGFLEHWADAQSIIYVYSTVLAGADKDLIKSEFRGYFDSILKNENVLNRRMKELYPIADLTWKEESAEIKQPVEEKAEPEAEAKVEQPEPKVEQPEPEEKKEGFIESTYYVSRLYKRLLSVNATLSQGYESENLVNVLSQTGIELDKEKISETIWNIQHLSSGVMKSFIAQHDEALKGYYKDVTGKELDNEEPLSEDVIKAYSELSKDEGNLKQHAEAIRYFGDTVADYFEVPSTLIKNPKTDEEKAQNEKIMSGVLLNRIDEALSTMDLNSPNYVRLNRWAEILTVNQLYHNAATAIRKAADDAFKTRNSGAEAVPEEARPLDEAVSNYDAALRRRLRFLSLRLETRGRGGRYSPEFNKFSEELKFAAEHGDLEMLGYLAENYLDSNTSQLQPDLERIVVAQEVKILVPYSLSAMQYVEDALEDIDNIKYGKPVVSRKTTEESVKEDILKAARAEDKFKADLKIDPEFKRALNGFSNKYKLKDYDEILIKYYEKNIQNDDKLTDQVRKWAAEAYDLKMNFKDASELQEKIEDGIRQIKAASIERIQQRAEQNDKFIEDVRRGGRRGFLEHWAEAQNILSIYRAVLNGPDKDLVEPGFMEHFDSIVKNGKALDEMKRVFYPDFEHLRELEERRVIREALKAKEAKAKPAENKQPAPAEKKPEAKVEPAAAANVPEAAAAPNYYERDKDALDAFKIELKNAMTGTNSGEYKAIINTISSMNKKEIGPWGNKMSLAENHAAKLASIKQCIDDYIVHKRNDGVKRNVYKKLAAVEKLNEFVSEKLTELKNLGVNSIPDKKINAIYVAKVSDIPRESFVLKRVNEESVRKHVELARLYGIDCSVEDSIAVSKCMDRIINGAQRDKSKNLVAMKYEWSECPGKELSPAHELAFNAIVSGRQRNCLNEKDRNDYDRLLTAQGYDYELTDAEAAALRYAEVHKLDIEMKAGGNGESKNVSWDEAKRNIAQAASDVRKKAASSKAGDGELASLQDKLLANIDAVKDSAILYFIGKSDENLNFLNSIENDKALIEKWPEISRDIAPFARIIAKESASYNQGKVKDVLKKYDEMEKTMSEIAFPHAEKIKNGRAKLYDDSTGKQKSKEPLM